MPYLWSPNRAVALPPPNPSPQKGDHSQWIRPILVHLLSVWFCKVSSYAPLCLYKTYNSLRSNSSVKLFFTHLLGFTQSFPCLYSLICFAAGEEIDSIPTQWPWIWANSRRWWRTGKLGVLPSIRLQRARNDLVTEQRQQQFALQLPYKIFIPIHSHLSYQIMSSFLMTAMRKNHAKNHAWHIAGAHQILATSIIITHFCIFQASSSAMFLKYCKINKF